MVINDLVIKLNSILGIKVMVFADDIAVMADCLRSLIIAIKTIIKWCSDNKMELNKNKSHIVFVKSMPKS